MSVATHDRPLGARDLEPSADVTLVACALCKTPHSLAYAHDWWSCATCGASWDAHRLEVVAAYASFCVAHDAQRLQPR